MAEAVLLHVVARAEHQSGIHLGLRLEQRRHLTAHHRLAGVVAPRQRPQPPHLRQRLAHGRPQPCVAQPRGQRRLQVDGPHHQRLGELRRPRQHAALVVEQQRVPVEDQLVLAADEVGERDRGQVVARALDQHPLAVAALARVVRRSRGIEDQRGAGQRLVRRRRAGRPDVLADRQPEARVAELEHGAALADLEVALLVEHAVVGEHGLAVDGLQLALGQHRERVVDVVGALREADQRDDPLGLDRELGHRLGGRLQEVLLQQQVLGRIAGDRQLGEQHQLGARVARLGDALGDLGDVALEVADTAVDLGERDAQGRDQGHAPIVPQAALFVRRLAGRRRPRGREPSGGTPAAADSSSIACARSAAKSSRSAIAS